MNNEISINIADYHIKKFDNNKKVLSQWEYNVYSFVNEKIVKIIKKYKPHKINFLGDIFDSPPSNIELFVFYELLTSIRNIDEENYKGKDIEIILIEGNHELLANQSTKTYFHNLSKKHLEKLFGVKVYEYNEVKSPFHKKPILYCGHGSIHKLEGLIKNYSIVFSHFRSSDPNNKAIYTDEIDMNILKNKANLIVLGDIHHKLSYEDVVYTSSPICTHFSNSESECSVLLLNEKTLEHKWIETLGEQYQKKIISFDESCSAEIVHHSLGKARQDFIDNHNFYKIKIIGTKAFINSLKLYEYNDFSIVESIYTDTKIVNEEEKEIADIVNSSNLSNLGTALDFEGYVEQNNTRKDLSSKVKNKLSFIMGGVVND